MPDNSSSSHSRHQPVSSNNPAETQARYHGGAASSGTGTPGSSSSTSSRPRLNPATNWSASSTNPSTSYHSSAPRPAPSTMMMTPTYYEPQHPPAGTTHTAGYQDWMDSYGIQQHQQYHDTPASSQYQYVQSQYTPPAASTSRYSEEDYVEPPTARPGGSGDAFHQQQQDMYYYAPATQASSSSLYHPPPAPAQAPTNPSQAPANPSPYTPSSDLSMTLPSSSHSLSPASWTEEVPSTSGASGPGPSKLQRAAFLPNPPPSSSSKRTMTTNTKKPTSRKRQKKAAQASDDSETESDDDLMPPPSATSTMRTASAQYPQAMSRLPGACTHCKKLKMKCDFPKNDSTCKRCKTGGHRCVVEGRKPRTAPNKREYLLAQIRQKDTIIESLLKQLHNPYTATPLSIASYRLATSPTDQNNVNIITWLDRLQSSVAAQNAAAASQVRPTKKDSDESVTSGDGAEDQEESDGDEVGEEGVSQLPDSAVPLGLIAKLSLSNSKKKKRLSGSAKTDDDDNDVGVANSAYFMPGPNTDLNIRATMIEQHSPPDILVHGLVTPADVDKLFELFYERVNPFVSILDPVLHTPASTFARCPFLFTVICAISSRYYTEKSEVYPIAMHFAKHSAANALIDGWKSIELCQAYVLMSIYAQPAKKWEEDRSWLYTGLAIRIATDLNLHVAPSSTKYSNERQEREALNKMRVWMICFNLDRSTSTQFGKPTTIKEDYLIRNSEDWYKQSTYSHPYDVHACAYAVLLRIVGRFHDEIFSDPGTPSGLNKAVDFRSVTLAHDEQLVRFHDEWSERFTRDSDSADPGAAFRCTLLPFLVGYSRLVMYSFGFQQAFTRGLKPGDDIFFQKCLDAAKTVVRVMIDVLTPSGYMRYAPDGHFVFAAFASAFLLKLLRPEFSTLLSRDQETEILELITRLIKTLSSPEVAIDDRHTPKLYARFLAGLLMRHRRDGASLGHLQSVPPPSNVISEPSTSYGQGTDPSGVHRSTFSVAPPQTQPSNEGGYSIFGATPTTNTAGTYQPNPTFTLGEGTLDFSSSNNQPFDFNFGYGSPHSAGSEEDMLAAMQSLKNPAWWENMMMPGFSWPEPQAQAMDVYHQQQQQQQQQQKYMQPMNNVPNLHHNFGVYQSAGIPLG